MRLFAAVFCLCLIAVAGQAQAALIVSIGSTPLQPNARDQPLSVFVRSDSDPVEVIGMNLFAFIGDGSAVQLAPSFDGTPGTLEAVRFGDGAGGQPFVWENLPSGFDASGEAPQSDNVHRSSVGVLARDPANESVTIGSSDTLVAEFLINTTGFSDSTFDFTITQSPGASSDLIESGTFNQAPLEFAGSFKVAAVPEPSSLAVLGILAAAGAGRRRMRKRKQQPSSTVPASHTLPS